jgi:prepilin-type N-terminal cleavage/methylation domain-containing protein/prepilin-type processing-associated H-X9-DG protein
MRKCGFTVIELLVVIAIIALLMAILFPSLNMARSQARTAVCGSNQHQVALAFGVYLQENKSLPYGFNDRGLGVTMSPPPGGYAGGGSDKKGWWWFNYLQVSIKVELNHSSILHCPSKVFDSKTKSNILCGNYGVNRSVCKDVLGITSGFGGETLPLSLIRRPAGTLLTSDSGYSTVSWMAAAKTTEIIYENPKRVDSFYIPGLSLNQTRSELAGKRDAIDGRHPGRMLNLGFTDGHNERKPAEFLELKQSSNFPSSLWSP